MTIRPKRLGRIRKSMRISPKASSNNGISFCYSPVVLISPLGISGGDAGKGVAPFFDEIIKAIAVKGA